MGTTEETYTGSQVYYYRFGGKPKADWSDIEDPSSRLITDQNTRPLDPSLGQKSSSYRTRGLSNKYTTKVCLSDFQKEVWKHLRNHGLDTIAYLQNPHDTLEVFLVVTHHSKFSSDINRAEKLSKVFHLQFDDWDKKHDHEAKEFLLNSIHSDIKSKFDPFTKENDTFAITWLRFIKYLVTVTAKTFDDMKAYIRLLRPQQFEGQNIKMMSNRSIG